MMKWLVGALAALFIGAPAYGQPVQQSGVVTRNHLPYWISGGVIGDAGSAADSPISTIGATGQICSNSARVSSGAWASLCLQANTNSPSTITLQNYGTAPAEVLNFVVDGTTYPFPGALASITINSTPVIGGTNGDCLAITSAVVGQVPCSILSAGTTGTGAVVLQNSPTLAGTIGGNLTFSGNEIFTGNVSMGSQLVVTGVSTPASASNQTVVMGSISPPTLANTGQAWLFNQAVAGASLQGDGSSFDFTLLNKSGGVVAQVPTGTTSVIFPGILTLSGLSSGTCTASVLLNSSNQTITGSCPGAASAIQVGTTTITSGTSNNILYDQAGVLGNGTIASFLTSGANISVTGTTNATISLTGIVPAANGGAGTINGVLAGNGSGVVSQGATSGLSDVVVPTVWTPSDQSGAALTFTSVTALYTRIGKHFVAQFTLTFPSTSNTTAVSIGGLPIASSSSGASFVPGACSSTSNLFNAFMNANSTSFALHGTSGLGATVENVNLSTQVLTCTLSYISN